MMTQHTKEPWRVGRSGAVVSDYEVPEIGGSDSVDYYGGHLIAESVTPSNASRIVACVNACEGIKNEELQEIANDGGVLTPRQQIADMAKQRDELLAAAKSLIDGKGIYNTKIALQRLLETIGKVEAACHENSNYRLHSGCSGKRCNACSIRSRDNQTALVYRENR